MALDQSIGLSASESAVWDRLGTPAATCSNTVDNSRRLTDFITVPYRIFVSSSVLRWKPQRQWLTNDRCFRKHLYGMRRAGYAKFRAQQKTRAHRAIQVYGLLRTRSEVQEKTGKWSYQYLSKVRTIWRPLNSCQDLYLIRIARATLNRKIRIRGLQE